MKLKNNLLFLSVTTLVGMLYLGHNCHSMNSGFQPSNFANPNSAFVNNIEEVTISIISEPWSRQVLTFNHYKLGNIDIRPISTSRIFPDCDIEIEEIMHDEVCVTIGNFHKAFKMAQGDSETFDIPGSNVRITIKADINLPPQETPKPTQETSECMSEEEYDNNSSILDDDSSIVDNDDSSTLEKKYKNFKRSLLNEHVHPQSNDVKSSKQIYRCNKCYWTGHPTKLNNKMKCKACGTKTKMINDCFTRANKNSFGKKLLDKSYICFKNDDRLHNGFIYDKRFINGIGKNKINALKENNEMCWFYCYSCKKYFLVPIDLIK